MDLLSRLLALMPVAGRLDVRCHFGAPWRIDQPGTGPREIRYHVLLNGRAIVEDAHGAPVALHAGDIVLFPSGSAHVLHDGSGAAPAAVDRRMENGVALETNTGDGATADVLCGSFLLPAVPQRLLRENLPARLGGRLVDAPGRAEMAAHVEAAGNGHQREEAAQQIHDGRVRRLSMKSRHSGIKNPRAGN